VAFELEAPAVDADDVYVNSRWRNKVRDFFRNFYRIKNVTAAYTVEDDYYYIRVDATAGAVTVTLPVASKKLGRSILIKKVDSSGNAVTVSRQGTDTIEGSNTVSLAAQWNKTLVVAGAALSWEKIV
jgi:uncharacterized membrane protein